MRTELDLVDRIYEAAVLPDLWPSVLSDLKTIGEGHGAMMFTHTDGLYKSIACPVFAPVVADYIEEGWPQRTDRQARLFGKRHAGFLGDLDVYSADEIENEPVYRDFFRPRHLGWATATAISLPDGNQIAFSVERPLAAGPVTRPVVERLDLLRPHLARAALLSARLRHERAQAAADALEAIGIPAAVLNARGLIQAMNRGCEALISTTIRAHKRLILADTRANTLLDEALTALAAKSSARAFSIPVRADETRGPTIAHVVPLRGGALDIFAGGLSIVVFTAIGERALPAPDIVAVLFDLTPAEARVALGIADGKTVDGLASTLGVSRETIRTQLKAVMAKTETTRQGDLSALLTNLRTPASAR